MSKSTDTQHRVRIEALEAKVRSLERVLVDFAISRKAVSAMLTGLEARVTLGEGNEWSELAQKAVLANARLDALNVRIEAITHPITSFWKRLFK